MEDSRLAVVIPAHCEEATIGQIVTEARKYADAIVVDDCSSDATGRIAREAGAAVVRNAINLGYDQTLSAGFAAAADGGYTHVVTLDADGEHDPSLLADFRSSLLDDEISLVLGVRPQKQRISEVIMGWAIRHRYGANDILCGMKGYDLALWRANGGFDHNDGIGTELAVNALKSGVQFREIAVHGKPRVDEPRFDRSFRANVRIMRALFKTLSTEHRSFQAELK